MFSKKPADKPQGYARMSLGEYLAHEARKADFAFHETNPVVWATFFANGGAFPDLKMIEETPVHLFLGRYALYLDPFDAEREGLNWALSTSVVDIPLSVTFDEFLSDCPALCSAIEAAGLDKPALTDSFMFADLYPAAEQLTANGLIGLNSPVAKIHGDFSGYLESLTSERRKKFRRAEEEFSGSGLRFELSNQTLSDAEFVFVVDNLKKKWGEDYLYALCQTLWSLAVSRNTPQNVYFMRVYDGDRLVFLQTMIARGQTMVCQSIVKDEETHYNGIAAYTDFQCVKALSGGGFLYFDPSCRTGLNDPESIGIAKRATVNQNLVKPIFCAGKTLPDQVSCIVRDKVLQGKPA